MGFAPPPDGPAPGPADQPVTAGLAPSPPAASLCGFTVPTVPRFKFKVTLPFAFPPPLPIPHFQLGIKCSLTNPLSVGSGVAYGGGRTPNADPDPDYLEQNQGLSP